jgi:hypothetical protein
VDHVLWAGQAAGVDSRFTPLEELPSIFRKGLHSMAWYLLDSVRSLKASG